MYELPSISLNPDAAVRGCLLVAKAEAAHANASGDDVEHDGAHAERNSVPHDGRDDARHAGNVAGDARGEPERESAACEVRIGAKEKSHALVWRWLDGLDDLVVGDWCWFLSRTRMVPGVGGQQRQSASGFPGKYSAAALRERRHQY